MATRVRILTWGLLTLLGCSLVLGDDDLYFFGPDVPSVSMEDLQGVVGKARALKAKSDQSSEARAGVAAAVATAASLLPPVNLKKAVQWIKGVPAQAQPHLADAVDLLASIREMGVAAPCLERSGAPAAPIGQHRFLIAANLFQCEALMPYWTLEVLRLALMLQGSAPILNACSQNATFTGEPAPEPTVHISIYESGSTDNTAVWLDVAEALWSAAGLRTFIVRNGSLTRQTLLDPLSGKFYKQHRIEYLASLRNAALEPLYKSSSGAYDYVYFINDVFFCAPDLFRLTHLQADIACGLDFEVWVGEKRASLPQPPSKSGRRLLAAQTGSAATMQRSISANAPAWQDAVLHMVHVHNLEAARQAASDQRIHEATVKPRYEFFDTWVSRDIGGNPFIKTEPVARDKRTIQALTDGLPIPAKCCWNGAALINASHLSAGLRFRPGFTDDDECDISECSLLCEDYRRLGSKKVAVDPSVRVSYVPWTKDFHGRLAGGIGAKVPWQIVQRSGALEELRKMWRNTQGCMSVQCLPMDKHTEEAFLDKFKVIRLDQVTNYTQLFFERIGKPQQPPPMPKTCNLIMGPYGAYGEGRAFDDMALSDWGRNAITRIFYRTAPFLAPGAEERIALSGIRATYGVSDSADHGGAGVGTDREFALEADEFFNYAMVYHDEKAVYGLQLETNKGRSLEVGSAPSDVNKALGIPCPADAARRGRFRLIALAGTSDKFVRSLTFVWT